MHKCTRFTNNDMGYVTKQRNKTNEYQYLDSYAVSVCTYFCQCLDVRKRCMNVSEIPFAPVHL